MSTTIDLSELAKYGLDLKSIADEYAATTEKHLRKCGNTLKKEIIEKTPSGASKDTYTSKSGRVYKNKTKLKNAWTGTVKGLSGSELEYDISSKAHHFHLVNRGHAMVTHSGKHVGFVPGKHFLEEAVKEYEESGYTEAEFEKYIKDVKKKLGE